MVVVTLIALSVLSQSRGPGFDSCCYQSFSGELSPLVCFVASRIKKKERLDKSETVKVLWSAYYQGAGGSM